jgi:anti-sigma B factor antagonist
MKIDLDEKGGVRILRLAGSLDTNATPEVESQLMRIADESPRRILVDLVDVDFVSSVGFRAFLLAARKIGPAGGTLSICGPNEAVRDAFDMSGFSKLFKVFETEQEALSDL